MPQPPPESASEGHSVTQLIGRLRDNDPETAQQIWRRYCERLLPLAHSQLRGLPHQAIDAEDVLISVFDRFFRVAKAERFARLEDREDLWQILLMLTERRVADHHRTAATLKRGGKVTVHSVDDFDAAAAGLVDAGPGPEFVAAFNDQLRRAIERLTDVNTREVALLRMEGYETREIAEQLDISMSSVERKLRVIREVWQQEFLDKDIAGD